MNLIMILGLCTLVYFTISYAAKQNNKNIRTGLLALIVIMIVGIIGLTISVVFGGW